MDKGKTIKEFERDVRANRLEMDRLNRAYYGVTFDELVTALGRREEVSEDAEDTDNEHTRRSSVSA